MMFFFKENPDVLIIRILHMHLLRNICEFKLYFDKGQITTNKLRQL